MDFHQHHRGSCLLGTGLPKPGSFCFPSACVPVCRQPGDLQGLVTDGEDPVCCAVCSVHRVRLSVSQVGSASPPHTIPCPDATSECSSAQTLSGSLCSRNSLLRGSRLLWLKNVTRTFVFCVPGSGENAGMGRGLPHQALVSLAPPALLCCDDICISTRDRYRLFPLNCFNDVYLKNM